jgi:hypothetical protein
MTLIGMVISDRYGAVQIDPADERRKPLWRAPHPSELLTRIDAAWTTSLLNKDAPLLSPVRRAGQFTRHRGFMYP